MDNKYCYSNRYYNIKDLSRVFKTPYFAKWAQKNLVSDIQLGQAALEIFKGHFEANLGSYVLKKRIATKNRGKSGSIRTIVAFKKGQHCFFMYGFEKSEKDNITSNEEKSFKVLAKELLSFSVIELNKRVNEGKLLEIKYEEKQNH